MKKETKKQLAAIFILLMFVGSSAAFALMSIEPTTTTKKGVQLVYDRPLENSEEAPFLQQNYVIVKYFRSDACADCDLADSALSSVMTELNGTLVIERIDTVKYANETEALGVSSVPTFYLKGKTIVVTNTTDSDDLVRTICPLYFYYIDACAFLT